MVFLCKIIESYFGMTAGMTTKPDRNAQFGAPGGRARLVISALSVVVLLGAPWIMLSTLNFSRGLNVAIAVIPVIILAGAAAFMVLSYEIRDDALLIKRPGWTTRIPLSGLHAVEINPQAMTRSIRVFGNGGLFAFNGLFWSKNLGWFRAYVTDLNRSVVLKLTDRVIVISPDQPEIFVTELRKRRRVIESA